MDRNNLYDQTALVKIHLLLTYLQYINTFYILWKTL